MRLAARLRREIAEGKLTPGMPTPSITTLSQQYGHARQTCAKALRTLEDEGLLTRVPGLGYYVTANHRARIPRPARHLTPARPGKQASAGRRITAVAPDARPPPGERNETPDPARSNALESRFHCVRRTG